MKNKTHFVLGLISSLLLTCGFTRAAERLDPMAHSLQLSAIESVAPSCEGDWPPQ